MISWFVHLTLHLNNVHHIQTFLCRRLTCSNLTGGDTISDPVILSEWHLLHSTSQYRDRISVMLTRSYMEIPLELCFGNCDRQVCRGEGTENGMVEECTWCTLRIASGFTYVILGGSDVDDWWGKEGVQRDAIVWVRPVLTIAVTSKSLKSDPECCLSS
jgi:hypothetical protein